jgi:hypothetical protein
LDINPKESIVDKVVNNPAYDLLGGYQLFLRRVIIPILLMLLLLFSYTIFSKFLSSSNSMILSFGFAGLMVGPVFNLDRFIAEWIK